MFYKKPGLPEENEIVICTIKRILPNAVFVYLDEYNNKEGLIHLSEVSPGRIRNIREFVKEGKKVICKVIKTNPEKNHIDLSLRRVTKSQRINKNAEYKQEQKAEKILESTAKKLKTNLEEIYKKAGYKIIKKYGSLTPCFQNIINQKETFSKLNIEPKIAKLLTTLIKEKIKPREVKISSTLILKSEESNGIKKIKKALKEINDLANKKNYKVQIQYISAPKYNLILTSSDYKKAEKEISELSKAALSSIKNHGQGEFLRHEKRNT